MLKALKKYKEQNREKPTACQKYHDAFLLYYLGLLVYTFKKRCPILFTNSLELCYYFLPQ